MSDCALCRSVGLSGRACTCAEFAEGMRGVGGGLLELVQPPGVAREVLLVLRVDGVHLAVSGAAREERRQEELRESKTTPTVNANYEGGTPTVKALHNANGGRPTSMLSAGRKQRTLNARAWGLSPVGTLGGVTGRVRPLSHWRRCALGFHGRRRVC